MILGNSSARKKTAKWALYYIDAIGQKFAFKLKTLKKPDEEFKILIHDINHDYDSKAIDLAIKTFEKKKFNMRMTRYKHMNNGQYGYIFAFSRMT